MQRLSTLALLKEAFHGWKKDRASSLAAALTYHTIFSITPLLLVVLAITGLVYQQSSSQAFFLQVQSFVGTDVAKVLQDMLKNGSVVSQSRFAFIIGTIITLIGSIGVFKELKTDLDLIWHLPERKIPLKELIKRHVWLFLLVIFTSLVLILSLSLNTLLSSAIADRLTASSVGAWVFSAIHQLVAIGIIGILFGILFKVLPDTQVEWKYVWRAGLFTSLIFAVEKYAFGLYLAHSSVSSAYGAAGSLVALLLWIFYSAQVFLFGAEMVKIETLGRQQAILSSQEKDHAKPVKTGTTLLLIGATLLLKVYHALKTKKHRS